MGFVFGLLMDVGLGAAMGQHALAYVVLAYLANSLARRVLWFPAWQQALHVLPLLLLSQVLMAATYPDDFAKAAAWSKAHPDAKGDSAVTMVESEPWDPSVASLVALAFHFCSPVD